ncbi:MAG: diguanylate cyclase [Terracidiphilus sp.]|jgi:GGDEF domain-containing protein
MNLRQMAAWGQSHPSDKKEAAAPNAERWLTLLTEGAALNVPTIDLESYKKFRANVSKLALLLPDRLPDEEKQELLRTILSEFESYRKNSDTALRERLLGWRGLVKTLLHELLTSLAADDKSPEVATLAKDIPHLTTAAEIQKWSENLEQYLHPPDAQGQAQGLASLKAADRSTANDNAAGLRGGGAAVEHLKKIMERGGQGYIALFRLSCLDVISQRFGPEAVEDCLMAVSAFLTSSLHSDDAIFHWSDSSLLVILQARASEQILNAELNRIVSQNRESSIKVEGRTIMLRTPMAYELTSINRLRTAEDLYRLSTQQEAKW